MSRSETTIRNLSPDQELNKALLRALALSAALHLLFFLFAGVIAHLNRKPRLSENSVMVRLLAGPPARKGTNPFATNPGNKAQKATAAKKSNKSPAVGKAQAPPRPKEKKPPKQIPPFEKPKPKPEKKIEERKKTTPRENEETPKPSPAPSPKEPKAQDSPDQEAKAVEKENLPPGRQEDIELARSYLKHGQGKGRPGSPAGSEAWSAAMAGMEADIKLKNYQVEVGETLARYWRVPFSVPPQAGLEVKFIVRVNKFGLITDWEIIEKSGNRELDESVLKMLARVKRVPAPPEDIEGEMIIPFRFVPGE